MAGPTSKPDWSGWPADLWHEMQDQLARVYEAGRRAASQIAPLPPVDVRENPERYVIEVDLPGVDPSRCDVSVVGRTVQLRGTRELPEAGPTERTLRSERRGGEFARTIELPEKIDESAATAHYHAGVLRVEIPRRDAARPHKVNVQVE